MTDDSFDFWEDEGVNETANGPNQISTGDALFIGRVPISIDGVVFADVYAIDGEIPHLTIENFNSMPLEAIVNLDSRSETQRFVDDVIGIDELPGEFTLTKDMRGPYYGLDQMLSKVEGMKSAWNLVRNIYHSKGDMGVEDVYYVEVGNSG